MIRNRPVFIVLLLAASVLCLGFVTNANADIEAATVVFASGEVQIADVDNRRRYIIKGDLVFPKETLITGDGRVQIKFTDGGYASLKKNTIYNISDYYYTESEREPVKSFFELVRGTVRFVTGKIGKRNRANFAIKTQTPTIGIRGSSGEATSCLNTGCPGRLDGTYLRCFHGHLFMQSGDSLIDLFANESGFCPADGGPCDKDANQQPGDPGGQQFGPVTPDYEQGNEVRGDHSHDESHIDPPHIDSPSPPPGSGGGYRK